MDALDIAQDALVLEWKVRRSAKVIIDCISNVLSTHQGKKSKKLALQKVFLSPIVVDLLPIYFKSIQASQLMKSLGKVKQSCSIVKHATKHILLIVVVSYGGSSSMRSKAHI
jgi:hypothetical protein